MSCRRRPFRVRVRVSGGSSGELYPPKEYRHSALLVHQSRSNYVALLSRFGWKSDRNTSGQFRYARKADCLLQERGFPGESAGCPVRSRLAGRALSCGRSEEHTSELQSLMRISYAVFCLKKK